MVVAVAGRRLFLDEGEEFAERGRFAEGVEEALGGEDEFNAIRVAPPTNVVLDEPMKSFHLSSMGV